MSPLKFYGAAAGYVTRWFENNFSSEEAQRLKHVLSGGEGNLPVHRREILRSLRSFRMTQTRFPSVSALARLPGSYARRPDLCYTFVTTNGRLQKPARHSSPDLIMSPRARILLIIIGLIVLASVINLMRTRRLKEEYALLWLLAALTLVATPILINPLDSIAFFLGIEYPPALFLGLGIVGLLLIIFQLSLVISKFSDQIRVLTQEIAILRSRLDRLENQESTTAGLSPDSNFLTDDDSNHDAS